MSGEQDATKITDVLEDGDQVTGNLEHVNPERNASAAQVQEVQKTNSSRFKSFSEGLPAIDSFGITFDDGSTETAGHAAPQETETSSQNRPAEDSGTVIDYIPEKTGPRSFALGMDYEEKSDSGPSLEKIGDFVKAAAARATDPVVWQTYIDEQVEKFVGIGEGLNTAKEHTKEAVQTGWTALTDGTVANFLSKPNAINDPLFKAVGSTLDAMAQDPNTVNHALENLGTTIMQASEHYSSLPSREQGHVIGETAFFMVNPEGSAEAGEAALRLVDTAAKRVDDLVIDNIRASIKSAEEMAISSPEKADQARRLLYDYARTLRLSPEEMELAGIPKDHLGTIEPMPSGGSSEQVSATARAESLSTSKLEGEYTLRQKAGAGGDWPLMNERPSGDVVPQSEAFSCSSACGEMLTNGELKQAELIEKLGAPCDVEALAEALGSFWRGKQVSPESLDALLQLDSSWGAELRELSPRRHYRRLELSHTVVVDGLDEEGYIMIRDPADDGTRYEMTRENFLRHWNLTAVWRSEI